MSLPYMKFYPTDWRADPRLRMCSLAARGLWIDLIGVMHEAEPYGHLNIEGVAPDETAIASLVGRPLKEVRAALAELENRRVFDRGERGEIVSRRMVRDDAKSKIDKANGRKGGNPKVKSHNNLTDNGGVNPQVKAQIPDTRYQKEKDAAEAAPDVELYRRGKEILGQKCGGMIKKLLTAKGGNIALARAALEQASTKTNARDYIGAIISSRAGELPGLRPGFGDDWG